MGRHVEEVVGLLEVELERSRLVFGREVGEARNVGRDHFRELVDLVTQRRQPRTGSSQIERPRRSDGVRCSSPDSASTIGAAGSALAPTFGLLLVSRFLWGTGAAGARVVSLAIVRDSYRGDQMARIMSLLTAVFITVPVLAPSIGAGIIAFLPWRAIFWFCVIYVTVVAGWAMLRLPETLDSRLPNTAPIRSGGEAARAVLSNGRPWPTQRP